MAKHYIAGSGSYGCLYDNSQVFETAKGAVDYLADLFELSHNKHKVLRQKHYVDLGRDHNGESYGADYAEVVTCECEDKSAHEDS